MVDSSYVAFLCDNKLLLDVEDKLVFIKYDATKNAFIGVELLNTFVIEGFSVNEFSKFDNQVCKEVNVEVEKLYTTRYYPRVYYTVFRIVTGLKSKTYLLERFDGKTSLVTFYLCRSFRACLKKIDRLEGKD